MNPAHIAGATLTLGAPHNWNPASEGECLGLPVRAEVVSGLPLMTSAWLPSADERARIAAGAPILLTVVGASHPPVSVDVGNPPG